ncbi:Alkyl hydroperoxide reductase subunit C-like protein [Desulfurella amilsii]|uniref:Alkyl hydroperoxide reductase subunit C-like protein n=1 Tax=Desulfurella amilsii TaxID=1562698 RepID=A0A1X4XV59_9BACT|nr:redoxin domain-containing protein [Desulfurella amilsii]OSS41412.1 Alkyl hydroperoxide reductase subunit C-like protein [Desulfurella amilsii]
MALAIGTKVENFTLKDQNSKDVSLETYKGSKVLLSFHPLAWTDVCAKQMQSLEDNYEVFKKLNTVCFGLSIDTVPSKKAWAEQLNIAKTQLLCDFWPHGEVSKKCDVFIEKYGFSGRVNILLDENFNVIFTKVYPIKELPDINEIIEFLRR